MAKPGLFLYIGRKVIAVSRVGKSDFNWSIVLEGNVVILNHDKDEVYPPPPALVGMRLSALSQSLRDTTMHFTGMGATKITVSLPPTKYSIHDPAHGGEVFPQWPEELEMAGIPAVEGGELSAEPSPEWNSAERKILFEKQERIEEEARNWLKEEE